MAEKYARLVWQERGNEDVLGLGAACCAGVILVRAAFSVGKNKSDREEGRKFWEAMQAKKTKDIRSGACQGKQLQDTKAVWTELAADVLKAARERKRESSKLESDIKKYVGRLT
jgi:hypothetical protein